MPLSNTENNFKFSKGDRVTITKLENLKNTGIIVEYVTEDYKNIYKVSLDIDPNNHFLFTEKELLFEDTSKERDWKLNQILDESI